MLFVRFLLLFSLLLPVANARAERSVQEEYSSVLWTIALRVHQLYFEEVHPDTLMQAAARGLFAAMDPASEYTFTPAALSAIDNRDQMLRNRFSTLMQVAQTMDENAFYQVAPDTLIRSQHQSSQRRHRSA